MISAETVALVESGWHQARILVVGDVMLDQYVWGDVERISPEAPVPIVRATARDQRPGGAANVAMNLARLGACVTLAGLAGGDREQEILESLLADEGIEPRLTVALGTPTTTKLRILSGHQQMMRLDMESRAVQPGKVYARLLESASAALPAAEAVVLSDYAKGSLPEDICEALIGEAIQRQIPVIVDPKQQDFGRYRGATTICPNLRELAAATGEPVDDLERVLNAGQSLVPELALQYFVTTLGEKGITVLWPESRLHAPAVVRQVYDVSGAGDTVLAILALALACRMPIESAVELANIAAGVVVGKVGTVPIQRGELVGALSQDAALGMDEKVLALDRLLARLQTWRCSGERIVFTNGCFDLLHIGHIRLLEEARRKGERLIVGLNSDNSVRRLKGTGRPIVSEQERARVLAALSAVDAVVVFEPDTPLQLIEAIRPDVLVKGGDYTEEKVVGAQQVRAWGGRVEIIPLLAGSSTTRLIAKSAARLATASRARVISA